MTVNGCATHEGTSAFAARHQPVQYAQLGDTGLFVSRAGFGGYRIMAGIAEHAGALRKAFVGGINLVDTSANYSDGRSEKLLGEVLRELIDSGELARSEVVLVSKAGYLQGRNYALSQERKIAGNPFPDLVVCEKGLEHCIHPEFLEDQLTRSLERLGIGTLDFYLLHNPEYYLEAACKEGVDLESAREIYYARIHEAFEHLENEVEKGRISHYGISSNTFVADRNDSDFTSLEIIWRIAESVSAKHHFRLIQFPFNLLETGAALKRDQLNGQNILQLSQAKQLGVFTNRPLNGFTAKRFFRLAGVGIGRRQDRNEIIQKIRALSASEKKLWMKLLPKLELAPDVVQRFRELLTVGESLKHYHLNFGSFEKWRQVQDATFLPRTEAVFTYLRENAPHSEEIDRWVKSHGATLEKALQAVASIYAEDAARKARRIKELAGLADHDWASSASLSQAAVRAVRTTKGVSAVLVGMRKEKYVADVLEEISIEIPEKERIESWEKMTDGIGDILS